jgi:hypothetical protein
MHTCFEVFMAVNVQILVSWAVTQCSFVGANNISEEHGASIFRA